MGIFKKITKLTFMFAVMAFFSMGISSSAAETDASEWITAEQYTTVDAESFPDNEELFAGYAEKVLYSGVNDEIASYGNVGELRLQTEESRLLYRLLKEKVEEVAAGKQSSTKFYLENCFCWTAEELGVSWITGLNAEILAAEKFQEAVDMTSIIEYLLMDCPFDFYWYDKTNSTSIGYGCTYGYGVLNMSVVVSMPVEDDYQDETGSVYQINTELIGSIEKAKAKAESIAAANEKASDYQKMLAYKNAICDLTSYNYGVLEAGEDLHYGNPWQLIWVFDEDEATNVVCEGYAKAFQYLCDLSNLNCYTVTGDLSHGTDAGAHMWNVVTLDGQNYLVDITNCDEGTAGYPDKLFLAGTEGSVAGGYLFCVGYHLLFTYEEEQIRLLGEEVLKLAETKYKEPEKTTEQVTEVFSDIDRKAWYVACIQYVYDHGIMSGSKGLFKPTGNITREQVAATLYNLEGSPKVTDDTAVSQLKDLSAGKWYTEAVCWAYNTGVATGNASTKLFGIGKSITRQQLAMMLYNYAEMKNFDVETRGDYSALRGANEVEAYAKEAMQWAYGTGLISGSKTVISGTAVYDLKPAGTATRGQMASILMNFCEANDI